MQILDLYINVSQQVSLSVEGGNEVHLSGFFEPQNQDMEDGGMFFDEEADDEVGDEDTNGNLS